MKTIRQNHFIQGAHLSDFSLHPSKKLALDRYSQYIENTFLTKNADKQNEKQETLCDYSIDADLCNYWFIKHFLIKS